MKRAITALLATLTAAVSLAAPAPYPLTINSRAANLRSVTVYRASESAFALTMVDGATPMNLTGHDVWMAWSTNANAATVSTSTVAIVSATNGTATATFSAAAVNHTPGRYYYQVGVSTGGTIRTVRDGVFNLLGSPYAVGADPVTWTINVNIDTINWVGKFPSNAIPSLAGLYATGTPLYVEQDLLALAAVTAAVTNLEAQIAALDLGISAETATGIAEVVIGVHTGTIYSAVQPTDAAYTNTAALAAGAVQDEVDTWQSVVNRGNVATNVGSFAMGEATVLTMPTETYMLLEGDNASILGGSDGSGYPWLRYTASTKTFSIGGAGDIIPAGSNTYSLGSAEHPFLHLHVSTGSVYIGKTRLSSDNSDGDLRLTTPEAEANVATETYVSNYVGGSSYLVTNGSVASTSQTRPYSASAVEDSITARAGGRTIKRFSARNTAGGQTLTDGAVTTLVFPVQDQDDDNVFDGTNIVFGMTGQVVLGAGIQFDSVLGNPGQVQFAIQRNSATFQHLHSRAIFLTYIPVLAGTTTFYNDSATNVYNVMIFVDSNANETIAASDSVNFVSAIIIGDAP